MTSRDGAARITPASVQSERVSPRRRTFRRPIELLLYAVSPAATLITAPLLARGLGPAARGEYGVATAVSTFALTLGAWGQAEVYLGEARGGRLGYREAAKIATAGGVVAAIATYAVLIALGLPSLTSLLTTLWIPLLTQTNIWRSVCIASGDLRAPALNNAVGPSLRIMFFTTLALTPWMTTESAITAMQLALLAAAALTMGLSTRRAGYWASESKTARNLLRGGGTVITFSVLNAVMLRSDLVVLQIFETPHAVGLYAAPASLTTAALALSTAFKSRLQFAAFGQEGATRVLRETLPVLILGVIGAAALWFVAPILVHTFFGPDYTSSIPLLRLLGVAAVPLLLADLAQGALVVLAQRRALITAGVGGASAVLISLLALCPSLGAVGAAIACVIGYSLAAIIAWTLALLSVRRLRLPRSED